MACEFCIRRTVEFADTDLAGIVHFSRFFVYMESTEHAFYRSLGLSVVGEDGEIGWPRVHARCDYKAPLYFEEEFEIHMIVLEKRSRSLTYEFLFRRGETEIARGRLTAVCVRRDADGAMRAAEIPESFAARLEEAR